MGIFLVSYFKTSFQNGFKDVHYQFLVLDVGGLPYLLN